MAWRTGGNSSRDPRFFSVVVVLSRSSLSQLQSRLERAGSGSGRLARRAPDPAALRRLESQEIAARLKGPTGSPQ
jgi:hypothetical protein